MVVVSKLLTEWQEYPDMDEGWMEQGLWFGVCSVFLSATSVEVSQCMLKFNLEIICVGLLYTCRGKMACFCLG